MRFEVMTIPVADVDRAKDFYRRLGWREDIDFMPDPDTRGVQFTPPGSQASIHFGSGKNFHTTASPLQRMLLIVDDIEAARADLVSRGVEVTEIFHNEPGKGPAPGVDQQHRSYISFCAFTDPDGNQWVLQEIRDRYPGRGGAAGGEKLAELLHETSEHHGAFEAVAPRHDWWDWYAAYMDARQMGSTPSEADKEANRYMAEVKHVVPA